MSPNHTDEGEGPWNEKAERRFEERVEIPQTEEHSQFVKRTQQA